MNRLSFSEFCFKAGRLILLGCVVIVIACSARKSSSLSAPEKRIHLNAQSLAPPLPPPPPGPPTHAEVRALEKEWRKKLGPVISMTPTQREQLQVTAYFGNQLGCAKHKNCFLDMRYTGRKQITDSGQIDTLLNALNNAENFGLDHMACFSPGVGLSFEAPGYSRNLLICLQCKHLLVEGNENNPDTRMLNDAGVVAIEKEFKPVFPKEFAD